jgi:hypothetical protein
MGPASLTWHASDIADIPDTTGGARRWRHRYLLRLSLAPRHGRRYNEPTSKEKAPAVPAMDAGAFVFYVVKNDSSTPTLG